MELCAEKGVLYPLVHLTDFKTGDSPKEARRQSVPVETVPKISLSMVNLNVGVWFCRIDI